MYKKSTQFYILSPVKVTRFLLFSTFTNHPWTECLCIFHLWKMQSFEKATLFPLEHSHNGKCITKSTMKICRGAWSMDGSWRLRGGLYCCSDGGWDVKLNTFLGCSNRINVTLFKFETFCGEQKLCKLQLIQWTQVSFIWYCPRWTVQPFTALFKGWEKL